MLTHLSRSCRQHRGCGRETGRCEGLLSCRQHLQEALSHVWGWGDAGFSSERAQLWEVGPSFFPAPDSPPRKVILRARKERWSFRKNHVLLRAEGVIMLKHGVEEMTGHRAKSRGLGSRELCRKPSSTCHQALDLELETCFSEQPTGRPSTVR